MTEGPAQRALAPARVRIAAAFSHQFVLGPGALLRVRIAHLQPLALRRVRGAEPCRRRADVCQPAPGLKNALVRPLQSTVASASSRGARHLARPSELALNEV